MSTIKVLGIDLGKSCFHLIGRDEHDHIVFRKKVSRPKLIERSQHLSRLKPVAALIGFIGILMIVKPKPACCIILSCIVIPPKSSGAQK